MYTLNHDGERVGTTKLERGDPEALTVSGVFDNIGGSKALAGWIKSVGGEEDNGVVFIALNEEFALLDQEGNQLQFAEGHLISVPDENEVYIDIKAVSAEDYKESFASHVSALDSSE